MTSPYEVLGVAQDATPEQIKAAYRKLAMQHHPDRNGDSDESKVQFQKIQEAYDALKNPKAQSQNESDPFGGEHPFAGHPFAWAFRNGEFWNASQSFNADYTVQAAISLEDAYHGTTLSVTINNKVVTIEVPKGAQHGHQMIITGEGSRENPKAPPGNLRVIVLHRPHPVFEANGDDLAMLVDVDVLHMIVGSEVEIVTLGGDRLTVSVPQGSSHRTRLRVSGKGLPNGTGGYGDLYIHLNSVFSDRTPEQVDALRKILNS